MGLGPTVIQCDLILTWLHLQRPCFQIRSHRYRGLGLTHIILGGCDSIHNREFERRKLPELPAGGQTSTHEIAFLKREQQLGA